MGDIGDTIVRGVTDVATFGTAEIANSATGGGLFGPQGFLRPFNRGQSFTGDDLPSELGPQPFQVDPAGVTLISQVALGTPVDDALGSIYGIKPGSNFDEWSKKLSPDDLQQIIPVRQALLNVQSDVTMRNQAVDNIVRDYPNIVATQLKSASDKIGPQLDAVDAQVLNRAADQLAGKFNAQGGFSSGAFNEALSKTGVDLAINRQNILSGYANDAAQKQYEEARAQQVFQQTMLGRESDKIYNARQAALDRVNQNFQAKQGREFQNQQQDKGFIQGLFGTAGSLAAGFGISRMFGGSSPAASPGAAPSAVAQPTNPYGYSGGSPYYT